MSRVPSKRAASPATFCTVIRFALVPVHDCGNCHRPYFPPLSSMTSPGCAPDVPQTTASRFLQAPAPPELVAQETDVPLPLMLHAGLTVQTAAEAAPVQSVNTSIGTKLRSPVELRQFRIA